MALVGSLSTGMGMPWTAVAEQKVQDAGQPTCKHCKKTWLVILEADCPTAGFTGGPPVPEEVAAAAEEADASFGGS